jgi:hypothetical protein
MTDHPKDGGPAFPHPELQDPSVSYVASGMSLRAYAAIQLRQPDSGIDWLDDMIRSARRDDLAGQALNGLLAQAPKARTAWEFVREAYICADAMAKPVEGKE